MDNFGSYGTRAAACRTHGAKQRIKQERQAAKDAHQPLEDVINLVTSSDDDQEQQPTTIGVHAPAQVSSSGAAAATAALGARSLTEATVPAQSYSVTG